MDMHDERLTMVINWNEKFQLDIKKKFFHHKDSQTMEQVAQKGFAVPTLEDFQDSAG